DYPRSPRRGPARGSVMVVGVAVVAGVWFAPAVAPEAVIRAFDLQGGVADVEALAQHGRGRVSQRARIDTVLDHQVDSHRGPGGRQRPDVQVVDVGHAGQVGQRCAHLGQV